MGVDHSMATYSLSDTVTCSRHVLAEDCLKKSENSKGILFVVPVFYLFNYETGYYSVRCYVNLIQR